MLPNLEGCIAAERAWVGAENTTDEPARGASKYAPRTSRRTPMMGVKYVTRVRVGNLMAEHPTREAERQRSGVAREAVGLSQLPSVHDRGLASLRVLL